MKTRISGKEAARVAEDMAKPGPIRVVATSEVQEAPGALVPSPGSELDRRTSCPEPTRFYSMRSIATAARGASRKSRSSTLMCMPAGQAVVGVVESPGGGDQPKSEDQPHAKQIAHAPQSAVWSADKEREPVPVSGDAERAWSRARQGIN
jgi:hypothetical protein